MTISNGPESLPLNQRLNALVGLGQVLTDEIERFKAGRNEALNAVLVRAKIENPWFTESNALTAMQNWALALDNEGLRKWVLPYGNFSSGESAPKLIGVVNAGNIPLVGLHDMISVLISGHSYLAKNATGDSVLLPYIAGLLMSVEPGFQRLIKFVPRLEKMDAVIATGNNNSARYFEYYFGKYPHIIRMNRNGVAVLTGNETKEELHFLGKDIFDYFGLGCRNVSKMYVPRDYNFDKFFESIYDYKDLMSHSKYMNNFDYHNSVLLLKRIPFLQNGFLIIREEKHVASPVSVVHYEYYRDRQELSGLLANEREHIQCIAAPENFFADNKVLQKISVSFGQTQCPQLWDYADGVDTLKFLSEV